MKIIFHSKNFDLRKNGGPLQWCKRIHRRQPAMPLFARALALLACAATFTAVAQAPAAPPAAGGFPAKPIRLVVTFPPGGSADAVVRMLLPRLNEALGQPVVVDNRPGAGGNVGLTVVAKAPADGYTLGVG